MTDSVHRSIEPVGTSAEAWETAAANAVATASETQRDLRIARVIELDMQVHKRQSHRLSIQVESHLLTRRRRGGLKQRERLWSL